MIGVTVFGLIFTPVFYVICRWLSEKVGARRRGGHSGGEAQASAAE